MVWRDRHGYAVRGKDTDVVRELVVGQEPRRRGGAAVEQRTTEAMLLATVSVELPLAVVQGAHRPGLEPAGDAVEVEGVLWWT